MQFAKVGKKEYCAIPLSKKKFPLQEQQARRSTVDAMRNFHRR